MKKNIILFLTFLSLLSCENSSKKLVKIEGTLIPIDEKIDSKKEIEDFVAPFKAQVESEMNKALSYTPINLTSTDGELESTLGNFMADLCYQKANPIFNAKTGKNIDFAMFNFGGIRADISKGGITNLHAFKLMPFENQLVVVELSANKLNELVHYLITEKKAHPLSKQVKLTLEKNGYSFKINNKNIDSTKTYFVLTSDYLQNGGDHMNFFKNPISLFKTDYKFRNAIIDYLKETDTVTVRLDGRFSYKK